MRDDTPLTPPDPIPTRPSKMRQRQHSVSIPVANPQTPEDNGNFSDSLPSLKVFIDADPNPTFIVPINLLAPVPFELLLWNHAFDDGSLQTDCQLETDEARQFRAWTQVVTLWREQYQFAGRTWTAFKIEDRLKCIRATGAVVREPRELKHGGKGPLNLNEETIRKLEEVKMADARLASLYRMMEMSDVGTFEYAPEGNLLRANVWKISNKRAASQLTIAHRKAGIECRCIPERPKLIATSHSWIWCIQLTDPLCSRSGTNWLKAYR